MTALKLARITFDMLAKFHQNAVALTADIEKAFLMVGIKQEDHDRKRRSPKESRNPLDQIGTSNVILQTD